MSWDDEPPKKDELKAPSWDAEPPSKTELSPAAKEQPGLMDKSVNFLSHANGPGGLFFKGAQAIKNGGGEYLGRAMDYLGGGARTALATGAGLLKGDPNAVTDEDYANTLKGKAPSSAAYMEKLGVPKGPSVDIPLAQQVVGHPVNVSARDVGGFATDVATNPLTYASGLLSPAGEATVGAGEAAYKAGLKKIDERLLEKGKTPLSDILLKEGAPTGTTKDIQAAAGDLSQKYAGERQGLYNQANDLGASVDLGYPLKNAEGVIARMRDNPALEDKANALSDILEKFKKAGKVPVDKLSNWKSDLTNALPQNAFDNSGKLTSWGKQFEQALAQDFKEGIVGASDAIKPGLGQAIDATNDKWGSLISAEKPLDMQVRRANTTNAITPVDAVLGSLHPGVEGAKKLADISKTTWARTNAGKGLMNLGESGAVDPVMRQALINYLSNGKKISPSPENKEPGLCLSQ